MTALRNTDRTKQNLIDMARELNFNIGGFEWADTFSITDPDDWLTSIGVKPAEILRAMFFGHIEEGVPYLDALVRWNAYGNLEIISPHTIENEAWEDRDEILEAYRDEYGADRLDEALAGMDTDATDEA